MIQTYTWNYLNYFILLVDIIINEYANKEIGKHKCQTLFLDEQ